MILALPLVRVGSLALLFVSLVVFGGLVLLGRRPPSWRLYARSVAVAVVVLVLAVAVLLFGPWPQFGH